MRRIDKRIECNYIDTVESMQKALVGKDQL
jgi:hypothetical protein